ncbi:hypothetical protein MKX75_04800 [Paenibacillus sp. FSL R5-0341]|uniref:hypothetical protein n=1 Tax=Paenibacillus sp. FSL R5-0341 TaxID=2921636 RepID=UPI0030D0B0C2
MSKKSVIIAIIIGLIILILPIVLYFSVTNKAESALPDSNISLQTKTINGLTITLRNATYTDQEVHLGYEIQGGGQSENDLEYVFYNKNDIFADSAFGNIHKLGDKHYYITTITDQVRDLPEQLDLTFEIKARSDLARQHDIVIPFKLNLKKS